MHQKPVIIFGMTTMTSLACYCLTNDSDYTVKGFVVDRAYLTSNSYEGLPVYALEDIQTTATPETNSVIIPIGFSNINGLRREKYQQLKAAGYRIINYISSKAVIWPDLSFSGNCIVYENAVIQPFAKIGENVTIRSGANIGHHNTIESHCFISVGATFGGSVTVGEQSFLGVGSVIRDNINIAERTFIGAGAVVVSDTEPGCVYIGNPARKIEKLATDVT